ncbi:MAG TPA: hypothetical protein P5256_00480 [Beijerinckiaceae bacterium]|jgi:hypothetical protein|nr:hypothetical protein [Hyphomicrobiales bacterium]MCO5086030.1 hypothetical protein [Methylobacteriaceae bacterium]HRY01572.1 hypothetical protein [Beijerinckiaceae bacterium]
MSKPTVLYKTTIEIWTDYNPACREIDDLAQEAMIGSAFCSLQHTDEVTDPAQFPDTDFFGSDENEADE